jgi:hypothetical protein
MPYVEMRNQHYRSAAPMRLYEVGVVEDYAAQKRAYFSAESRAARKEDERRRLREMAHDYVTTAALMREKMTNTARDYVEYVPLNNDVLSLVTEALAESVEPFGVYGPSLVAQDLAHVAQTCKQMYLAHHAGMKRLGVIMVDAAIDVPRVVRRSAQGGDDSPYNRLMRGLPLPLAMSSDNNI